MSDETMNQDLTEKQMRAMERGVYAGLDTDCIIGAVLALGEADKADVETEIEKARAAFDLKKHFKKEGARLIREFLERAKSGSDVDDISALLELAIYRDLLRRYAEDERSLSNIPMDELLKLDLSYRRVRLAGKKAEFSSKDAASLKNLSAKVCVSLIDKIGTLVGDEAKVEIQLVKESLVDWAKKQYGEVNVEGVSSELRELSEIHGRAESLGAQLDGENGDEPKEAFGIAG